MTGTTTDWQDWWQANQVWTVRCAVLRRVQWRNLGGKRSQVSRVSFRPLDAGGAVAARRPYRRST